MFMIIMNIKCFYFKSFWEVYSFFALYNITAEKWKMSVMELSPVVKGIGWLNQYLFSSPVVSSQSHYFLFACMEL